MKINTIEEAVAYVESKRDKKELTQFKQILETLHIDDEGLNVIHVTGTNGKGSTVTFLRNILNAAGYRVGTFTSPYIICHQDRIMIDGKMISEDAFIHLVEEYQDIIERYHLSMFEIDVLFSLVYFKQQAVDYCIYEVGIGGEKDKTNVVHGMASVITTIGHDHLDMLGPRLEDVARHKAGIIKPGCPVFVGDIPPSCERVILDKAKACDSEYIPVAKSSFDLSRFPTYQKQNASLALTVVHHLFPHISKTEIQEGLDRFFWPARFEKIGDIILDGAHNIEAMAQLLNELKEPHTVVFSALNDKAFVSMASMIRRQGHRLVLCVFEDERALTKDQMKQVPYHQQVSSIEEALQCEGPLVFCGSLHFVADVRKKILKSE